MGMRNETGFQLEGSAPEAYEAYLVPTLFETCARHLIAAVGLAAGARVVDVACGTGVVGRQAAELVGPAGRVVGVDVNPAMVAVAARLAPGVTWRVGDAGALPLADASVDAWCCQQGLQFVSDRRAVLAEAGRVLAPGGRLAIAVWRSAADNPAFDVFADALADVVGDDAAVSMRAPFALGDREELRDLLVVNGFDEPALTLLAFAARFRPRASCCARRWRRPRWPTS
jgi:SAM-dependent methyltransferase